MPTPVTGLEASTPVKIKSTSATERGGFRKCRRQWFLTQVHRLSTPGGNQNLWLGTLVHAGLEAYYKVMILGSVRDAALHETAVEEALTAYQEEYDKSLLPIQKALDFIWGNVEQSYRELGELGFDMLVAYFEREIKDPMFDEIVEVEQRLLVPIRNPKGNKVGILSVKADIVGRKNGGRLGVGDHKTASREMASAQLDIDDQLTAEAYAVWQSHNEWPEFISYNVLMKKVAHPPKRLKDGKGGQIKLSRDKDQDTTYALYLAALKEHGLDPAEYSDILELLNDVEMRGESKFFRREEVFRTPDQIASFEQNLYEEWRDMKAVAAHPERAYPNPSPFSCPSCSVRLVCTALMDAGDVEAIIQASYVVADPRR
jgi:hypothetical protein